MRELGECGSGYEGVTDADGESGGAAAAQDTHEKHQVDRYKLISHCQSLPMLTWGVDVPLKAYYSTLLFFHLMHCPHCLHFTARHPFCNCQWNELFSPGMFAGDQVLRCRQLFRYVHKTTIKTETENLELERARLCPTNTSTSRCVS